MNRLREYREHYGWSQQELIAEIRRCALERGDPVAPGLDQPALSRHECGVKRPGPRNRELYCLVYGATPAELGFRAALPQAHGDNPDVNREGLAACAALPSSSALTRLGQTDVKRFQESLLHIHRLDDLQGSGAVYIPTVRMFNRLRDLVEHASYDTATSQDLRELAGRVAAKAGWLSFDADRHDDARRWWLEATHWAKLTDTTHSLGTCALASMGRQASDRRRPREALDLTIAAQRSAGHAATPRLTSMLNAHEAMGHAGIGDATRAHAALRRARQHVETRHDDDPPWLNFYGPAEFAAQECLIALTLGDSAAAEEAARTVHALGDLVTYPRNYTLGLIELADVLAQRHKIDESAAIATQAAIAAVDLDSGRITRRIRDLAKRFEPLHGNPDVDAFLALVLMNRPGSAGSGGS
jgi:transcriptional regulator with XRE-family HTH domain